MEAIIAIGPVKLRSCIIVSYAELSRLAQLTLQGYAKSHTSTPLTVINFHQHVLPLKKPDICLYARILPIHVLNIPPS